MLKLPTAYKLVDVARVEPLARRDAAKWKESALAVILYCPHRHVEKFGYLFSGEEGEGIAFNHFLPQEQIQLFLPDKLIEEWGFLFSERSEVQFLNSIRAVPQNNAKGKNQRHPKRRLIVFDSTPCFS